MFILEKSLGKVKDFNLVHHPTPEKLIFSYSEKSPQAGFEPGTPTTNPEHKNALGRSAMAPL